MKTYKFYFPFYEITQTKVLIQKSDWETIDKMIEEEKKEKIKELTNDNEYFIEGSPLFNAIESGYFECNNIKTRCVVEKQNVEVCDATVYAIENKS